MLTARRRRSLPAPDVRRLLRVEAQLTQDDIAVAVGATRAAVSRWESGEREPRSPWRERYAELLERLRAEVVDADATAVLR
ncbi:MAG: helix-turn-helix domain-containing protein [Acidimicrobiia bacterium]|nr:helix-turn-helix domain-containing protein [Acidimicrobiia bacterium]